MSLDAVLSRIDADLPKATERLMELLRIPSMPICRRRPSA